MKAIGGHTRAREGTGQPCEVAQGLSLCDRPWGQSRKETADETPNEVMVKVPR